MITEKYRVPGKMKARYVRRAVGENYYIWCEQSAENLKYDIAQGTCEAEDLPEDIKNQCDNHSGYLYACEWPK